jgi:dTDP-4-dehydrorhamnose 3,5-epimerase
MNMSEKFKFKHTKFDGLYIIAYSCFNDARGKLTKYFQKDIKLFNQITVDDVYTTFSKENVVRGMHHQINEFGQAKYITCLAGEFWDIAIDLRPQSKTFKEVFTHKLACDRLESILIPAGFSHGTYSLSDATLMLSVCSGKYIPDQESGISMESLGLPFYSPRAIVSVKDSTLLGIEEFK